MQVKKYKMVNKLLVWLYAQSCTQRSYLSYDDPELTDIFDTF